MPEVMSQEELQKWSETVWEHAQEEIKKNIEYAIFSELRSNVQSMTRRITAERLRPLIDQMIAQKSQEIEAAMARRADELITKATERFEADFVSYARSAIHEASGGPFIELGKKLSGLMYRALDEILQAERLERLKKP